MIAPRTRLVFWTGVVLCLAASAVAASPESYPLAGAAAGVFILVVALDAYVSRGLVRGVAAELPEVARLTKDREGEIAVTVINPDANAKCLVLALDLPPALVSPHKELAIVTPADAELARVSWPVTGTERGRHLLENVYFEGASRLGFWSMRKAAPARGEVRVYPNTVAEWSGLAAMFLNRGLTGIHAQRQVGKGKDFEKLREYTLGDSYEDIHWKATAKRGRPITKVFQVERTQEVYVVIDSSRLSARRIVQPRPGGTAGEAVMTTQLERFITAAMVLGLVAQKQGDLFGVLSFDDRVRSFIRAKNGKAHYGACRDALYTRQPRTVNPDFGELFSFIRLRLRRRALLILLTNLDDPVLAEYFIAGVGLVARHHLIMVNTFTSPDAIPLFSGADPGGLDEVYGRLAGHLQWHDLSETNKVLQRSGVMTSIIENEMMCPQIVSQYLSVKQRQAL